MKPAILEDQKILVSSIPYFFSKPKKDDIVAFKLDSKTFVKRIQSTNGNNYFLQGDNKNDSLDSRKFGVVERKDILGKVIWH